MFSFFIIFILLNSVSSYKDVWIAEDWVVDFLRPTVDIQGFWPWEKSGKRQTPFNIPDEQRKAALLINGSYPGPTIEVMVGEEVEVTLVNKMHSESITIHWHGLHQKDTPFMDGARGIAQAPILPGDSFTYKFIAQNPGTHYWHSHMDSVQASRGLKGPIVIHPKVDQFKKMYTEEVVVNLSDEWRIPEVCLRLEGAMAGNDVCSDIRWGSMNGQYGNGSSAYPFPLITVEKGKCYRFRWIMMGSNTENFVVDIKGHNMTLISLDGVDVVPIQVSAVNLHLGERADTVICADQEPGNYLITLTYDYACSLTKGNFIPPGFSVVPNCRFYGYLNYKGHNEVPHDLKGTGGGKNPKPRSGVRFDLTNNEAWNYTRPIIYDPEPEEPDIRYVINLGLKGPIYSKPTDEPLTKGMWYMDLDGQTPRPWEVPKTPLLHTKGTCGVGDIPLINIPKEAKTIELVINNLSPTAHVLHMHGNYFKVINYENYKWCSINSTACFVMPYWANPCPLKKRQAGDPNNKNLMFGMYWGCKYDEDTDKGTQNLRDPLMKDSFQVWQRSWAVIRFKATIPGMWYFHCHMNQHISLGMQMVFNVLPDQQPAIPADVPTQGPCPVLNVTGTEKLPTREQELLSIIGALKNNNDILTQKLDKAYGEL